MEKESKSVRKFIFDHFLEKSAPPALEQIMGKFKLNRTESLGILKQLEEARHLALLKGTERILMAWPFSSIATPFRATVKDKGNYFANCSWDSIAFHVMLGNDVRVDSFCHHCGEEIRVTLRNQRVESANPSSVLVYLALPAARWWDDIITTCSNTMTFFSSKDHLAEWMETAQVQEGEAITLEQTLKLSIPIYTDKMSIDYARPSKAELSESFESIGLHGNFWKL